MVGILGFGFGVVGCGGGGEGGGEGDSATCSARNMPTSTCLPVEWTDPEGAGRGEGDCTSGGKNPDVNCASCHGKDSETPVQGRVPQRLLAMAIA